MVNVMDQDQQWLLNCLNTTLDPNQETRSFPEASLHPAAVLLTQFIKKHWHEGEDSLEPPVVATEGKQVTRRLRLPSLDDSHRKICTAIMPFLLKLINDQTHMSGRKSLECSVWMWLLNPDLESSGSVFVGSYILQLILHLPLQMATHIRDLVAALVQRMQSAQIVGLKSSLLLIIDWYVPSILDASASVNSNYVNFLLPSRAMLKDIVK
uniref:Uncharacterized protein n=1 Tax=Populus trichocarpa TaxID=3694 RepID=A0A2K1YTG9_POPTR